MFGIRGPGSDTQGLRNRVYSYLDASKRTVTRAIRDGASIVDGRYTGATPGATFTDGTSLVQFGTLDILITYYTTTETT